MARLLSGFHRHCLATGRDFFYLFPRGCSDGFDYIVVTGAAAYVAFEAVAYFGFAVDTSCFVSILTRHDSRVRVLRTAYRVLRIAYRFGQGNTQWVTGSMRYVRAYHTLLGR